MALQLHKPRTAQGSWGERKSRQGIKLLNAKAKARKKLKLKRQPTRRA